MDGPVPKRREWRARTGGVVRFRILGPLEVWTGQDWSGISAPKWRALLAALVLNRGQAVSTDRLITELWVDGPPERAANLVSVYVLRLRRVLGDPEGHVLITRAPGYQLLLRPGDLDAEFFETLVARGRQAMAAGDVEGAAGMLREALELWRGRALDDAPPTALVTAEADRLEESRLSALELRIEADLGCALHAQLVPELRRLLSDHPLREGLWARLIRALDGAGRHAEALAAYGQAREVISDELGVEPGPELQRLYLAMLSADVAPPAKDLPEPRPGPSARAASQDPGSGPSPGGAGRRAGPGSAPRRVPAQLPADVADFTGRSGQVERLRGLVSRPRRADSAAVTVAVVAGTPGLGKTTLAIHTAHTLRPEFPDGQLYASLLGGSEEPVPPDEVLARFLRDLGVDGARVPVDGEERAAMFRTRLAERQMLTVLDDARDAAQVRPLLPGTGSCAVIVTSRHRLPDLAGSRLIDLDVLDDGEAAELFTRIIGPERAEAEPEAVREVLAACAGLPLAIRIAGARLNARRSWTVATLATRLADERRRMDEFTAGDLAVRACFEVSFGAMHRPERPGAVDPAHAFRLLGVWQGPTIGPRAASALIGEPEWPVTEAVEMLVDAHLLESPAPDVYAFHQLLRVYAAERAQAQEPEHVVDAAVRRVLTWYLRTADAAASVVSPHRNRVPLEPAGPGEQPVTFHAAEQALGWCEQERANIVAATRQAAGRGMHDIAWKLPVAAMVCFDLLGYRTEWITTHRVGLASARELGDRRAEVWVLNNLGMVLSQQRDPAAIDYFEQAMAIHRETGDLQGEAQATNNLAFHHRLLGRHEESAAALLDALRLNREAGHRYGEAIALCNLGEAYLELGRHDDAIARSKEALEVIGEIGSVRLEGYALYNLGRVDLDQDRTAQGAGQLERALGLHRSAGDRYGEAQDLQYLGAAQARQDRLAEARQAWARARTIFESLGEDARAAEIEAQLEGLET
jgi:DNA-binding SARP family transcriptional activator